MTGFTSEYLERFYDSYMAARGKLEALTAAYAGKDFRDERARGFARHGFPCRLALMLHCIEMAMEDVPPRIHWVPHAESILRATLSLQAFVVDVFGCIDNLAHIWVCEKGVTAEDGTPLPDSRIGLRPENGAVLESLSPAFAGRLKEFGPWFEYLDRFRRALEHEVPLYNTLEALPADRLRRFRELAGRIEEAQRRRDQAEVDRLTDASNAVVSFFPITAHAFGENARREFVQFQMASDFDTVEEIARRLLVEFD